MLNKVKISIVALGFTLGFAGAPALAQPLITGGLVNVTVNDVLNDNRVGIGVAAGIAAQVCGLTAQVGVIAQQVARTGAFECTNEATGDSVVITR